MKAAVLSLAWVASLTACGVVCWKLGARSQPAPPPSAVPARVPAVVAPPDLRATPPAAPDPESFAGLAAEAAEAAKLPPESEAFANVVRKAFDEPDKRRRLAAWYALLEGLTPEHLRAIVPRIRENDVRGAGSGSEWSVLWEVWGKKDGASAHRFIQQHDWTAWPAQSRGGALYSAMIGWGRGNPTEAAQWYQESGNGAGDLRDALVTGWAANNPEAAADWAVSNGALHLMDPIFDEMSRLGGMQRLEQWMARAGGPGAAVAGEELGRAKLREDMTEGTAWIVQHETEPWNEGGERALTLVRELADKSIPQAMLLAHQLKDPAPADQVMRHWASKDVTGASQWLRDNPDSGQYDTAAALARAVVTEDPAAARAWATSIRDEARRTQALRALGEAP